MSTSIFLFLVLFSTSCVKKSNFNAREIQRQTKELRIKGQIKDASKILTNAIAIQPVNSTLERTHAAHLRRELASLLILSNELSKSEELYREALILLEFSPRCSDSDIINIHIQLGALLYRQSRLSEAASVYHRVLSLEIASLGEGHPDTINTLKILGDIEFSLNNFALAESIFRRQIHWSEKFYGPDSLESATALINLSEVLAKLGRKEESRIHALKAARIRSKLCDEC